MSQINNWQSGNGKLVTAGNQIIGIVAVVGNIASVGILMYIGIRYMISSPDDRANLKTRALPYLIGAILTFAAVNVINLVANMATWLR